jgi:subtilisin family serine protease
MHTGLPSVIDHSLSVHEEMSAMRPVQRALAALTAAAVLPAVAALAAAPATASAGSGSSAADVRSTYLVTLDRGVEPGAAASAAGRDVGADVTHVYRHALRGYAARLTPAAAARLARAPGVADVVPDRPVSIAAQTVPTGVDRIDAEQSPTAAIDGVDGRVDVDVAVIDTGIDLDHPDLNVYTAGARNCSSGRSADDGNGHGTHVAGTVGAVDNGAGVVGVAPGARLWPVRVLSNTGSGSWSSVICGVDFVTANADAIEVANMSLGGGGADDGNCGFSNGDLLHRAVCASVAAGVTYVVAAGNSAANSATAVPASYDEVITVSALADFDGAPGAAGSPTCRSDEDDTFANFSNHGADVDVIAPGVCILSTYRGGGYSTLSGTSMASPHVAGAAALYLVRNPSASPTDVRTALRSGGTLDWTWPSQDPDGIQEPLLDAGTL